MPGSLYGINHDTESGAEIMITVMNSNMNNLQVINPRDYGLIVFFTGAGMSAESGIPTYRGSGGIWNQYNWEEYACQRAFERNPEKVLEFHELRRSVVLECQPHPGYIIISELQMHHQNIWIVTQNIDGMHQRAGNRNVIELHGSLWRLRCPRHGVHEETGALYKIRNCPRCGCWLRPDITWFEDILDTAVLEKAGRLAADADLFISIGTSGVVFPAATFPVLAYESGACMICINTEIPENKSIFEQIFVGKASEILGEMFNVDRQLI